jgi:hypothetical protein
VLTVVLCTLVVVHVVVDGWASIAFNGGCHLVVNKRLLVGGRVPDILDKG